MQVQGRASRRHHLDLTGVTILIVEDDGDSRDVLRQMVECWGAEAPTAGDGFEAMERLAHELPDLVLCDLLMPRMDGYELLKEMQQRPHLARIPVVAVSALGARDDLMRTFTAGFRGHLVKPIELRNVEARLRTHFRHRPPH